MKLTLLYEMVYGGFGIELRPTPKRQVELLGVQVPVDPGMVTIKDGDDTREIATLCLEGCPLINFEAMLTPKQKAIREGMGALLFTGVVDPRRLVPLEQCPLAEDEALTDEAEDS